MLKTDAEEAELLEIDPTEEEPGQPEASAEVKKPAETPEQGLLKEMRRSMKELRTSVSQANQTAQFWMQKAQGTQEKAAPAAEEEPKLSVDLVEAIANGDVKAITAALKEMGFARTSDVQRDVDRKLTGSRNAQNSDQALIDEYPELADSKSEFFRVTAEIYNNLLREDPSLKGSNVLTKVAAELAEKRLGLDEPAPARGRRAAAREEDDEEEEDGAEADRVRRVAQQSGGRNRRPAQADPASTELDRMQKSIVAKLRAAGGDISEEGYKKRATAGIRMSGLPTRRARY
jgi:hypothetical protein